MKKIFLVIALMVVLTGCGVAQRQQLMTEKYPSYPQAWKDAIAAHKIVEGMDKEAVYLSLGPTSCIYTAYQGGVNTEIWGYQWIVLSQRVGFGGDCRQANIRVFFTNGKVSGWENFPQ
jgi:hypothetical protein